MLSTATVRDVGRGVPVFPHPPVRARLENLLGPDDVLRLMDRGATGVVALVRDAGATFLTPIYHELAGIICTSGTPRSHIGILSREFQLPCSMATVFVQGDEPHAGREVELDCSTDPAVIRA